MDHILSNSSNAFARSSVQLVPVYSKRRECGMWMLYAGVLLSDEQQRVVVCSFPSCPQQKYVFDFECNFKSFLSMFLTLLVQWYVILLCSMYDMIWFYLHKITALWPNYNVQYKTKRKRYTQYDQKQSLKYNNRQQRNKAKLWSRRAKKKIESKKSNYGSLLLINST